MKAYVEEAGSTTLCNVSTLSGCADGEKEYVGKWSGRSAEEVHNELAKLRGKKTAKTAKREGLLMGITKHAASVTRDGGGGGGDSDGKEL
mmetsp:Transcript_5846/g.14485  ORF Transcript_5846/g.14485 Transcript_5846/m.14485 type:complete len:90 (+) Transcript_5846:541-810(+)